MFGIVKRKVSGFLQNRFMVRWSQRRIFKLTFDGLLLGLAYSLAYLIRFDFALPVSYATILLSTLPLVILIGVVSNFLFGVYQSRFEYASIKDLIYIFVSVTWSLMMFVLVLYLIRFHRVPRSILMIYWMLGLLFLGGARFSFRIIKEFYGFSPGSRRRVLVIGAGSAGEMIIRQMKNDPSLGYYPAGLVDDDTDKHHSKIHGVPVLGGLDKLQEIVRDREIEEIVIATPSAKPSEMRRIVRACEKTGVEFKTVPGPRELMSGDVSLNQIRKVRIEDLLEREPVQINLREIETFVQNKVILITGAGGSIGSELARQIVRMQPRKLVCLDRVENSLFYLEKEMNLLTAHPQNVEITVADIMDREKLDYLFFQHQPDIVFHAAAYKHVPLMELHPEEAVHNNVFGTLNLLNMCSKFGVGKFVQISTDKAVNPTSVMGATKRVAELLVHLYSETFDVNSVIVRFGNVLASYGSVVPLFQKQIARGGPITVTHPDMKRFFMTIPEAVKLILEAAKMGNSNEIYILDMGEPIKIVEFARHLISLSGLEPERDIPIEFIGMRPGEKLEEELWNASENPVRTAHQKIMMAKCLAQFSWQQMQSHLAELQRSASAMNREQIFVNLKTLVPEYNPTELPVEKSPPAFQD